MKHLTYLLFVLYAAFAVAGCASKGDLAKLDDRLRNSVNQQEEQNQRFGERLACIECNIKWPNPTTRPVSVQVVLPTDMLKGVDQSLRDNGTAIQSGDSVGLPIDQGSEFQRGITRYRRLIEANASHG
jgi:hypothetical protein